jgi:hypothetical protein
LTTGDDLVDPARADAAAGAGAAGGGRRRRDERVGAVVDVEQRGLAALEQHRLAAVQRVVQQQRRVGHHRAHPVDVGQQLLDDGVDLDGLAVVDLDQHLVLQVEGALDLLPQDPLVEQVLDPDADAVHLVGVRRADARAGGADPAVAEEALGHLVQRAVVRGDQVRVRRQHQLGAGDARGLERVDLLEQHRQVDHHAVADDRRAARREDAARQQVQGVGLVADDDGVPALLPPLNFTT